MYHQKNADFLFFSRVMHVTVKTSSVGRSDTISYVTHTIDLGQLLSRILRKISIPQMLQIDQLGCPKCHRSNSWDDPNVTDRPVEMIQMSQIDQVRWSKCHTLISWDDPNVTDWPVEMTQMSRIDQLRWAECHRSISWVPNVTDRSVEMTQMSHIEPNLHFKYRN